MVSLMRVFLVFVTAASLIPVSVQAKDRELTPKEKIAKEQFKVLNTKVHDILKELDKDQTKHFMTMYTNYTIFSAVKAVRGDVQNAVEQCSKNNPDMANDLRAEFSKWEVSVGTKIKEADESIQNLSLAQNYVSQADLKSIFGLVDDVRAVNSSRFETTPVTTSEACSFMMSKMEQTKEQMSSLLASTLRSYPSMIQRTQE